ncbi:MAG: Lrp/AsnC family transcriptional regulator [Thermoplasmataceae archaeon]
MELLDLHDRKILELLLENSDMPLREIGIRTGIFSPSAISRRIDRLKRRNIIGKNAPRINYGNLGFNFVTITFVRAKYAPGYKETVARKILGIRGIVSIYFLLGDIDFVTVTISKNKEDYERILDELTDIEEIERTDSRTVLNTYKEYDISSIFSEVGD